MWKRPLVKKHKTPTRKQRWSSPTWSGEVTASPPNSQDVARFGPLAPVCSRSCSGLAIPTHLGPAAPILQRPSVLAPPLDLLLFLECSERKTPQLFVQNHCDHLTGRQLLDERNRLELGTLPSLLHLALKRWVPKELFLPYLRQTKTQQTPTSSLRQQLPRHGC